MELWEGLEDNDLSRWPKRIFARSYVRDYALRVGLDADEVVNEFCRLFPEWGDRRAERVIRGKAEILAHDLDWEDLPVQERRRSSDAAGTAPGFLARHRTRIAAVAIDVLAVIGLGSAGMLLQFPFWPATAIGALSYSSLATSFLGRSFGLAASDWLFRTLMSLDRRLVSSRAHSA